MLFLLKVKIYTAEFIFCVSKECSYIFPFSIMSDGCNKKRASTNAQHGH